jgi:hypothetical protein
MLIICSINSALPVNTFDTCVGICLVCNTNF